MLNAHMDSLLENSVSDTLVHLNTNGALGDVEAATGSAVVELVWHTLVDRTIGDNIDKVSNLNPRVL